MQALLRYETDVDIVRCNGVARKTLIHDSETAYINQSFLRFLYKFCLSPDDEHHAVQSWRTLSGPVAM